MTQDVTRSHFMQILAYRGWDVQHKINCCIQAYRLTNGIGPIALTEEFVPKIPNRCLLSADKVVHNVPKTSQDKVC